MKVRRSGVNSFSIDRMYEKEERKVTGSSETIFQNQLKKAYEGSLEKRLGELVEKIIEQGKKLGEKMDIKELNIYKGLISEFLNDVTSNNRKFSKQSFLDRRGRHRVYAIVKTINEELDKLTQEVLSEEKNNIMILQRLDDIRGLIMDIIM